MRGKRTVLRTPVEDDLASYSRWMADLRVRHASQIWHEPAMPATWKERLKEQARARVCLVDRARDALGRLGACRISMAPPREPPALLLDPEVAQGPAGRGARPSPLFFDYLDRNAGRRLRADQVAALRIAEKTATTFSSRATIPYRERCIRDRSAVMLRRWDELFERPIASTAPLAGR